LWGGNNWFPFYVGFIPVIEIEEDDGSVAAGKVISIRAGHR